VKGQAIITKKKCLFHAIGLSYIPLKTEEREPHRVELLVDVAPGSLTQKKDAVLVRVKVHLKSRYSEKLH